MTMTRKDYELIAETTRIANRTLNIAPYDAQSAVDLMVTLMADAFEHSNENFDRSKFIKACHAK